MWFIGVVARAFGWNDIIWVKHCVIRSIVTQRLDLDGIEAVQKRIVLSGRHDFRLKSILTCLAVMCRLSWAAFFL